MSTTKQPSLSASALKTALWETLQKVSTGEMQADQADSIATQAREILRTTQTQLKISMQSKREVPADVIIFSEK